MYQKITLGNGLCQWMYVQNTNTLSGIVVSM
ncbi:MAG: hypothetical protein YFSK_4230 [Candidatus Yanofskyibacterium parasiticum]|nr:MAG: hypothetical protein YFSK_4230 [Candidatus Yanofskybacteria bacterium]